MINFMGGFFKKLCQFWHNFFIHSLKSIIMTTTKKSATKKKPGKTTTAKSSRKPAIGRRKWSADVTEHSDALDLEKGIFTSDDPKKIARSLERSAEESRRKKGSARQSAASMLSFYINRAGKNLPASKKKTLNEAKAALKEISAKKEKSGKEKSGKAKKIKKA
jgi:hypothetical protein